MTDVIQFYSTTGEYGAFSNFARYPIKLKGKLWPTSEHYFQAMKFPTRPEHQEKIRLNYNPGTAKKLG